MFKKLKDKKGVALELSIYFVLIMTAFCYLMILVAFKGSSRYDLVYKNHDVPILIDQIGEDFYKAVKLKTDEDDTIQTFIDDFPNRNGGKKYDISYTYNSYDNTYELKLTTKEEELLVLNILIEKDTKEIKKWYLVNPTPYDTSVLDDLDPEGEE